MLGPYASSRLVSTSGNDTSRIAYVAPQTGHLTPGLGERPLGRLEIPRIPDHYQTSERCVLHADTQIHAFNSHS
jgi:hypothetical protein